MIMDLTQSIVSVLSDSKFYDNSLLIALQGLGLACSDIIDKALNKQVNLSCKKKFLTQVFLR